MPPPAAAVQEGDVRLAVEVDGPQHFSCEAAPPAGRLGAWWLGLLSI